MKIFSALLASLLLFSIAPYANAESPEAKIVLPKAPKAVVIILDYTGGRLKRTTDEPAMTITADGTVTMPSRRQGQDAYSGKLTPKELKDLLQFIIHQQKFFECDSQKIKDDILKVKNTPVNGRRSFTRVMDASTTTLQVYLGGKENEIRHYPSGIDETKVDGLVRFKAIVTRLNRISSIIRVGGNEGMQKWLTIVNEKLKTTYPNVLPFTAEDFQSGNARKDGFLSISFSRSKAIDGGKPNRKKRTHGSIYQKPGKDMIVSVVHEITDK